LGLTGVPARRSASGRPATPAGRALEGTGVDVQVGRSGVAVAVVGPVHGTAFPTAASCALIPAARDGTATPDLDTVPACVPPLKGVFSGRDHSSLTRNGQNGDGEQSSSAHYKTGYRY